MATRRFHAGRHGILTRVTVAPAVVQTRALDRCLACGSNRIAPLAFQYRWRDTLFPAAECHVCGMRFLAVQPTGATIEDMYREEYFVTDFRCGRSDRPSFDEDAFRAENAGLLDAFQPYRGQGRLLDVGCASGWLLKHARDRGWMGTGVELSADAVRFARGLGLDVRHGTLEDAALPAASYDLVYMGDVLEHVPDCRATLVEVSRVLAPGGHLFLRGPITTNSIARNLALAVYGAMGRRLTLAEPPYHLWEFRPAPLRRLFAAVGLDVVRLEEAKIPPGNPHGAKTALQKAGLAVLDTVNLALTRMFNRWGDRVVVVARRPPITR